MIGLEQAIDIVDEGLLVVYPTETVYGIGASISSQEAVAWVYEVKGTPEGTPFPVAVSSMEMARDIVVLNHENVLKRYLPGPFTFILPAATDFGWNGYIGLRIPDSALALSLIDAVGPITSTSANRHGATPPTSAGDVTVELPVMTGPECRYAAPSAVIDLRGEAPYIHRDGPIGFELDRWEIGT